MRAPALAFLAACLLAACGGAETEGGQAEAAVVLAATSLQEGLTEAAAGFAATGQPRPVISFAATSALARQIEGGAPADLFISADTIWMERLEQAGLLVEGSRTDLLTNRLVVIAPRDWGRPGHDPFAGNGKIAIAEMQSVPAGRYARAALEGIGRLEELAPRLVSTESVRAALMLVERQQVDRGIVYQTDALASRNVEVLYRFPRTSHPPIRYPAALLETSTQPSARAFLDYLQSLEGRAIMRRHGFGIAGEGAER